jgi:TolB-like protein
MRTRALAVALPLLVAAAAARAETPADAGHRAADSLLRQLSARAAGAPVHALAVAPLKAHGPGAADAAAAFHAALEAALGATKQVKVRAWSDLDQVNREKALQAAMGGGLGLPPLGEVQALVVGEATGAEGAPTRIQLRLVAMPAGTVLATESARVEGSGAAPLAWAQNAEATSVDVAIRRLSDQLAAGFRKLPGNARYERLAVLQFGETGAESKKRELGTVVTAELTTNLRRDHGLLLVERTRLDKVLSEMQLGAMGLVPEKDAPKLGKLADAQALVVGTVSDAGDRFLLNARIVSTETAETLATASEPVSAATLVALSSDAVVLRSRQDAAFRSLLVPGWGQMYNRQPTKAAIFAGTAMVALGGAITYQLIGAQAEHDYKTKTTAAQLGSDPVAEAADLRAKAEHAYAVRNGFLWALGGVWVLNVIDAYAFGVDGEKAAGLAVAPTGDRGATLVLAGRF